MTLLAPQPKSAVARIRFHFCTEAEYMVPACVSSDGRARGDIRIVGASEGSLEKRFFSSEPGALGNESVLQFEKWVRKMKRCREAE